MARQVKAYFYKYYIGGGAYDYICTIYPVGQRQMIKSKVYAPDLDDFFEEFIYFSNNFRGINFSELPDECQKRWAEFSPENELIEDSQSRRVSNYERFKYNDYTIT